MNKQELEKMFDEKVTSSEIFDCEWNDITNEVKQFIFDEIIPEVLKSILWNECQSFSINNWPLLKDINWDTAFFWRDTILKKAKDLYWITL